MKSTVLSLSIFLLVALFAVNANATHPLELNFAADCYGWTFTGLMGVDTNTRYINVNYTVDLYQGGVIVFTYTEAGTIDPANPVVDFDGAWDMELCGDYTAKIHYHFESNQGWGDRYFEVSFTCECGEPGTCTYTPGYWKNHPEAWPVTSLEVGGITYTQAELLEIFDYPTKGDITVILFHHTVAAKLNVLSGSDAYIQPYIDASDAFFVAFPLLSKPHGGYKDEGEDIKDALADYNEIVCEDDDDFMPLVGAPAVPLDNASAEQESTWGSIKSLNKK